MKTSKCCGAKIILTDICIACKEHADTVDRRDDNIHRSSTVHYPDNEIKESEIV
jgi:hypothetical protein